MGGEVAVCDLGAVDAGDASGHLHGEAEERKGGLHRRPAASPRVLQVRLE